MLNPERAQSHSPIFQVLFGFDIAPPTPPTLGGALLEQLPVPGWEWSRFDLSIVLRELREGGLHAHVEYSTDLFEASTIERLIGHLETLLAGAVARDPDQRHLRAPAAHRGRAPSRCSSSGTRPSTGYDRRCLHELFAEQAARTPGGDRGRLRRRAGLATASSTRRSNQLARELRDVGVRTGTLVGICLERSVDLLVAMLGVLKAGAAYVPIEPAYPPERQEFMLADAQAPVLLTQERFIGVIDPRGAHVICLDRDRARARRRSRLSRSGSRSIRSSSRTSSTPRARPASRRASRSRTARSRT